MRSQLNRFDRNGDRLWCYFFRKPSTRVTFYFSYSVIMIIGLFYAFIMIYQTEYYPYLFEKLKRILVNSFNISQGNFEEFYQTFQRRSISANDLRLYDALKHRATNRSNRYYLHDFEYFRMIREEFPQTESAAKIEHTSGFAPLLPTTLYPNDVLFIVMGSVKFVHKARLITNTWLQWSHGNFFIFADASNASIPLITLPQLENKPSREDAQHRQFMGSQWLINHKPDLVKKTKWFVFVDDDTWINVPALLSYLQLFDYRMLLSIGSIWDNMWVAGWSYFSGGAGIVFSQSAFMSMMPAIYTKECPFNGFNDVTIMYCQKKKGITKIHSNLFFWHSVPMDNGIDHLMPIYYVGKVSFHYVNNAVIARRMTCDAAAYWKSPIKGCDDVKRDDMPHLIPKRLKTTQ